jgi:hypothetical protein
MHKTAEWVFVGAALIWSVTPCVLVALAWRKWTRTRSKGNPAEDFIDDPAFFIGQILATVSCVALAPFYIPATYRWQHSRLQEYGLILSAISALLAVIILPFGLKRAKWLSFVSCLLNTGLFIAFIFVSAE